MGAPGPRPLTLDTGALIGLEQRSGRAYALLLEANAQGRSIYIPATVLAQAWKGSGPRMAPLALFLKRPNVVVVPLAEAVARAVGTLCARRGTADIVDAHVAVVAKATGSLIVTSDPGDVRQLDPTLAVQSI